jgi:predicted GNAT superfamily acetyltransferase
LSSHTIHDSRFTIHALITIRDLTSLRDYADCVALQEETWGRGFSERVPTAILRVSQMIGGVAAGAFDANGRMVGFVFGLTGLRDHELVHWSDMLAVREELRGQGIGEQLKQYQRDKVMAIGVHSMLWTFDPLQAGNAHFNINHLGALPVEYVIDMYGSNTGSTLHGVLPTDRFIVRWQLDAPVARPAPSTNGTLPLANPLDEHSLPVTALPAPDANRLRVQIPADLAAVRRAGDDRAMRWRLQVRDVMTSLLSRGYRVTGFHRTEGNTFPYYLLERRGATA